MKSFLDNFYRHLAIFSGHTVPFDGHDVDGYDDHDDDDDDVVVSLANAFWQPGTDEIKLRATDLLPRNQRDPK